MKTTPTQVKHPWRASIRTFIQALLPTIGILIVVLPQVIEIITEETAAHGIELSPEIYGILSAAAVGIAAIAAIITRISAIPAVEALLERYAPGLSAAPFEDDTEPYRALYHPKDEDQGNM